MYSERLLDHFANPRHAGVLAPPALVVDVENPACGDRLRLSARIENGRVTEAAFQVRGCTASIACGSALAQWLHGRALSELRSGVEAAVEAEVGPLPPASRHAAALAADAVRRLLLECGG